MKKRTFQFTALALIILGLFTISCKKTVKETSNLGNYFTTEQTAELDKIIDFYDAFVLEQTSKDLPIGEAYKQLVNSNIAAVKENDFSGLVPEKKKLVDFYSTLDKNVLEQVFVVMDSIMYQDMATIKFVSVPLEPFILTPDLEGPYSRLLTDLSKDNTFYGFYIARLNSLDEIGPSVYYSLYNETSPVDFSKRDERLVAIISFMAVPNYSVAQ